MLEISQCEWLEKLVSATRSARVDAGNDSGSDGLPQVEADLPANVLRFTEYVKSLPPLQDGQRNKRTFMIGCEGSDYGISEALCGQIISEFANYEGLFDDSEIKLAVASAYKGAARKSRFGCKTPEAVFSVIGPGSGSRVSGLSHVSFADIRFTENEGLTLVEGLLAPKTFSVIFGQPNAGKSFFACDLAFHVATGRPFHGKKVEQGTVIYLAAESPGSIQRRFFAMKTKYRLESVKVPLVVISESVSFLVGTVGSEAVIATCELLKDVHGPIQLLIIDTAARVMAGGDENSGQDMGQLISNADRIRSALECHVSVVHHAGKDSGRGARGHSSLKAAVDTEIEVKDMVAKVTKQRDGDRVGEFGFELESVPVATGPDGFPVFVPVPISKVVSRQKAILRGATKKALEDLKTLSAIRGEPVHIKEWRDAFVGRDIEGQRLNTARKAFYRASNSLETFGEIALDGELVRLGGSGT